ncbi:GNAT family N-acetyltransferase [Pararhizobium arenae]|uniref:GNAT family N-acetyltransferase n=1 Tax=Pararhizobium arenae TaxID=1856850 RepID=UPI00094B4243|nr:GNAT family N-acetyltransferase [Pararhizobium arenae]
MPDGLAYRQDYFADPEAWQALVDLLQDTFGINVGQLDRLGGPDPTSRAFGYFDETGRCVANFSLFYMPLVIAGKPVRAIGYQSGAVRPEWRGRGLYRDLIQRAFAAAKTGGCELELLLTDKPALYENHGFRSVTEYDFKGQAPALDHDITVGRLLDLNRADDVALTSRMLKRRTPVSASFAVAMQSEMFLLNTVFDPEIRLSYSAALDFVVAWQADDTGVSILDLVAADIPTLPQILAVMGVAVSEITICFPPDRLNWAGEPVERKSYAGLMVRGDIPLPRLFALSPMAGF